MAKIILSEAQFEAYIRQQIMESFAAEGWSSKLKASKLDAVAKHMAQRAKEGDEDLLQRARENGINIDSLKGDLSKEDYDAEVEKRVVELLSEKNKVINDWVKKYLQPLRDCYRGIWNFDKGFETATFKGAMPNRDENGDIELSTKEGAFDRLDDETKSNVLQLREFLDKEGLTFIYRYASKLSTGKVRFGINIKKCDWNTPIEDLHFDFSKLSDQELNAYYTGTRVKWINDELRKLGYEPGVNSKGEEKRFSTKSDEWGVEGGVRDVALQGKREMTAKRYVEKTYGMDFDLGDNMFSFGNGKIASDTLIINFTAAMRCPAWNDCLVKDACYARNTERGYDNALNRNNRNNLVWSQTEKDPELMKLMLELVRSCIVNYEALKIPKESSISEPTLFGDEWNNIHEVKKASPTREYMSAEELCSMSFSEIQQKYGEEAIETLKSNKKNDCKVIRLNEDGDFIGQWLVDAWDEWAGDFKLVDVTVAAYTCRALNYEKISNLILNISQERLVNGQNSNAFAHFFYAVKPDIYNMFDETYDGDNFQLKIHEDGKIVPVFRNLVDEEGNIAAYYYKCPCGRGKFRYVNIDYNDIPPKKVSKIEKYTQRALLNTRDDDADYVFVPELNQYFEKVKNENLEEMADCYRCRICYGGDSEGDTKTENGDLQNGVPVYVFVSAHGSKKDELNVNPVIRGKRATEWAAIQNSGVKARQQAVSLAESVEMEEKNDPRAVKQIVKNTIESVSNMMRRKGANLMEQKTKFRDLLDRMG